MNLYLVSNQRQQEDCMSHIYGMVVAAETPAAAALICPKYNGKWDGQQWLVPYQWLVPDVRGDDLPPIEFGPLLEGEWDKPENLKVTLIGTAVPGTTAGVILVHESTP